MPLAQRHKELQSVLINVTIGSEIEQFYHNCVELC